jgi:hypothetical protein
VFLTFERRIEMSDPTEAVRREMCDKLAAVAAERSVLEKRHGKVYDTKEVQEEFQVTGFLAPCVAVTRKSDGVKGSMFFQGSPRFYFGFEEN